MVVRRGESPDKNETKDVEEEEEQQEEIFDDPENEDDDMIQLRKQYVELEIVATKTNGKLRLDICEDFYDEKRGLFIQSFLRPCLVEEEGLIKIGDELISINHHTVDGYTIDQLVDVLKVADSPTSTTALLGIRRRVLQKMYTCGNYSNEEPEGEDLNEDNQVRSRLT